MDVETLSDREAYQQAERAYYRANIAVRAYESHLPPQRDPEWEKLLRTKRNAQERYNALRHRFGQRPVWP